MFSIMFLILATKGFGMLKIFAGLYWACYISALNSTPQFLMTACSLNCTRDRDGQSAFFFKPKQVELDLRASVQCIQVFLTLLQPFTLCICHCLRWVCCYAEHMLISYAWL